MNVAVLLEWVGCSSSEFHAFPYQNPLVRVLSYMSTVKLPATLQLSLVFLF